MRWLAIILVGLTFIFGGCAQKYVVTKQPAQTFIHYKGTQVTLKLPSRWERIPSRDYPKDIDHIWVLEESKGNFLYPNIAISAYQGELHVRAIKSLIKSEQDTINYYRKAIEQMPTGRSVDEISAESRNGVVEYVKIKRKNTVNWTNELILIRIFTDGNTVFEIRYSDRANELSGYEKDFYQMYE